MEAVQKIKKMLKQILTPLLGKQEKVKIKRLEGVGGGGGIGDSNTVFPAPPAYANMMQ